ncbi:hypothetical protein JCM14076_07900 [Methylosoma difficile]
MKQLHRNDLFSWSAFNEERNLDFHSVLWVRDGGNVLIDPLPLSAHDWQHLHSLGGAAHIVVTNSDHCRATAEIAQATGAKLYGPAAEKQQFPLACDIWLHDHESIVPELVAYQLDGSKTPGELALVLKSTTLITGDLIRCHVGGELCLLPDGKLTDRDKAVRSIKRIASLPAIESVLSGDGWPIFSHGKAALQKLASSL